MEIHSHSLRLSGEFFCLAKSKEKTAQMIREKLRCMMCDEPIGIKVVCGS
jgi:cytochrome c-type biogenesis protein CcmH/NrfF